MGIPTAIPETFDSTEGWFTCRRVLRGWWKNATFAFITLIRGWILHVFEAVLEKRDMWEIWMIQTAMYLK